MRYFLKSGYVRGPPGDRRSYRNQAIQTTAIQPQLEQTAKAQKPHNHGVSPTLRQHPRTRCQTLRKGLYLAGRVGQLACVDRRITLAKL